MRVRSDAFRSAAILKALEAGGCVGGELAARVGLPSAARISGSVACLIARGRVIDIGTWAQAKAAGIDVGAVPGTPLIARVYALPGTPKLPPLPDPCACHAGSGVIAGPKVIRGYL